MDPSPISPQNPLRLALGPRSYDIHVDTRSVLGFGRFVREALAASWTGSSCRGALMVTDRNLGGLSIAAEYAQALETAGIPARISIVPPGEHSKALAQAERLYDELLAFGADRHTLIVAFGGGVVGDLAGFVAATFTRGVPLVMVPTTLLAQVDSSIGGKVGVNHPLGKNLIGAFHQPRGVWIDTATLETLPDRELRSGLAEVVKYGVIASPGLFAFLEQNADAVLRRDSSALEHIILESCRIKAGVVERDEREEGAERAMLNFGHTIAHAIETAQGYDGHFLHGEAVAAGMVAESRLAERLRWVSSDVVDRQVALLERLGLPVRAPGLDLETLLAAMRRDKKNRLGKIRFVLPRSIGRVELTDAPGEADIRAALLTL
jgi:3-dehydroquinate synthase